MTLADAPGLSGVRTQNRLGFIEGQLRVPADFEQMGDAKIETAFNAAEPLPTYEALMTITMYGIPNCDTIKKARTWLDTNGVAYTFHDYKKAGIDRATLSGWVDRLGWEVLLNRAGTTFRALPDADKAGLDRDKAIDLMLANPSMIKRPVLADGETLLVGFKPDAYAAADLKR